MNIKNVFFVVPLGAFLLTAQSLFGVTVYDVSFTEAEGFPTPTYNVGATIVNDWNGNAGFQIDAAAGQMQSITRGYAFNRNQNPEPSVGDIITYTMDFTVDITNLTADTGVIAFGLTRDALNQSTVNSNQVPGRLAYLNSTGTWNFQAEGNNTGSQFSVSNADMGISGSESLSDLIRIEWTAQRGEDAGDWILGLTAYNLATSTTLGSVSGISVTGGIDPANTIATGLRTFGPDVSFWEDQTLVVERIAVSVAPIPEIGTASAVMGVVAMGFLLVLRRKSNAAK